jgi:hypothetical protein
MKKFDMETPAIPNEDRAYLHTTRAGVAVPFSSSVITAVVVTLFFFVVCWAFGWRRMEKVGALVFVVVLVWDWLHHRKHWFELTRPAVATAYDHDDNPITPDAIRVELPKVAPDGHYSESDFDLPDGVTMEQMNSLAVGILDTHRPMTYREWAVGPGKVFTDPQYRKLQDLFEVQKLIEKKGTGFILTEDGKRTLESFRRLDQ